MSEEQDLEQKLQDQGLNAPRLTPAIIDGLISDVKYFIDDTLVICVITMPNGHKVLGHSRPVSDANFRVSIGQEIAFKNAREEIWQFAGYDLRTQIAQGTAIGMPVDIDESSSDA
jgi:hypothetical protein